MKVLFVTENPDLPIAKALAPRFDDFEVEIIKPENIITTLDKDADVLQTSDYHIVTDHLPSIPLLKQEMKARVPHRAMLNHALIALVEKNADMAVAGSANMTFYKSQGHIPLRNRLSSIRVKKQEKPFRHTFVR